VHQEQKHLGIEEIEFLIGANLRDEGDRQDAELRKWAQQHLDSCEACQRLVSSHKGGDQILRQLERQFPKVAAVHCPPDTSLYELAAGVVAGEKADELLRHTVNCDHCGPVLRRAVKDFADERTAEEEAFYSSLRTAQPDTQRTIVRTLTSLSSSGSLKPPSTPTRSRTTWIPALPKIGWNYVLVAAAIILVFATSALIWRSRPNHANGLLAQAYSEQRTMELRIPGARYAPMRVVRGGERSRFSRPASLLEAEELIGKQVVRHPTDPDWLQTEARAELLEGNYETAIRTLQGADDIRPGTPSILTDLATAYFLRAETTGHEIDYGSAIESLGKVLANSPDDPVALFNRAIVCERAFLYTQAIDDWEHYLRIDPRGGWADEARKHLDALKEKLKQRDKSSSEPLLRPSEIAKANNEDNTFSKRIDDRFEDYQRIAITDWLPNAYPIKQEATAETAAFRSALGVLANVAIVKHRDRWLHDLLSDPVNPRFPTAIRALANAVLANDRADTASAQRYAIEASQLFAPGRTNEAGILRARAESLFASKLAQDGPRCLQLASGMESEATNRSYRWLQIQLNLEEGSCLWLVENIGAARQQYEIASRTAGETHYKAIYLRTQDHLSGVEGASGDLQSGWRTAVKALDNFWSGAYPDVRGYNLYYELYELARDSSQPYLQMAVWRDGLALSEVSSDIAQRAIAHCLMADAAVTAHSPQVAEQEFTRAKQLFSVSPQIESTHLAQLEAEARLAQVETSQGEVEQAISRLKPMASEIAQQSDRYLAILYYDALSEAESRKGDSAEAESSLRSAVALSELQLNSLTHEGARLRWEQQSSDAYRGLVQLRLRRGDIAGALELWEWYRGSSLRSGLQATTAHELTPTFDAQPEPNVVAQQLPQLTRETFISYALLNQGLAIWVYDSRGVVAHWSDINPEEIEARIVRFRNLCSDPQSDSLTLRRDSRVLYNLFVAPIEPQLAPDRTLVIELDNRLSGLPLDALVDAQDHYFGERESIVSSLGLYYGLGARESLVITADAKTLIAAVSNPSAAFDSTVLPLPDAVSEGQMVADNFHSANLLTGKSATARAILAQLPDSVVFHFAGHALSSLGQRGLLLSDGLLDASSFSRTSLPRMQLAVFSACDTEDGPTGFVNEADSLVRIFIRAGVPHVIASRWSVDSTTTRQFMELFYRDLLQGSSITEAMRHTQSNLRSHPETAHPFYWSAFTAFGTS
jgi:CHAT domain-containing protein/tetratricopeptide (TPR) repeat protein